LRNFLTDKLFSPSGGISVKVYISVDLEGISGVVDWLQTGTEGHGEYERARLLMTLEASAAVEGAFLGGATEVVVNDSHGGNRNILIEHMHRDAKLISGSPKFTSMMEGIDQSFDAAIFVGYHARMGARGVLSHTYTGSVAEYRVNGMLMGETGMNAAVAGVYGVPVVMVTGDTTVTAEATKLLGPVKTIAVKESVGRYAAICLHPEKAREMIKAGAKEAIERLPAALVKPMAVGAPVTVSVKFVHSGLADGAQVCPRSKREDELTVSYTDDDYLTCLRAARTMMTLAGR
jgi:D-amino peptidase